MPGSVTVLCAFSVNVCVCVKCVCVSTECASRVCVASACESSLSVPSLCACVRQFVHACVSTGVRACRMVNAVSRVTVVSVYAGCVITDQKWQWLECSVSAAGSVPLPVNGDPGRH